MQPAPQKIPVTGQRIAQAVASRIIKVQLELGGKYPTCVRADAEPKAAAESLADGAMYNTPFVEHFIATVAGFKAGDPMDRATDIGATTRAPQVDLLDAQVADAKAKGATLHCGGHRLEGPGQHYAPTVFTDVDHTMELMREESFGPVIGIQKVSGDDEALRLMNGTRYGLTAGVYTRDESAAHALLAQLNAGSVYWNCCDRVSPRLPWSGHGDSGVGLALSTYGIQTFTRPRAWHLKVPA